jgi:hypothetical protein
MSRPQTPPVGRRGISPSRSSSSTPHSAALPQCPPTSTTSRLPPARCRPLFAPPRAPRTRQGGCLPASRATKSPSSLQTPVRGCLLARAPRLALDQALIGIGWVAKCERVEIRRCSSGPHRPSHAPLCLNQPSSLPVAVRYQLPRDERRASRGSRWRGNRESRSAQRPWGEGCSPRRCTAPGPRTGRHLSPKGWTRRSLPDGMEAPSDGG